MYNYKAICLSSHSFQFIVTPHLLVQLHLHLIKEVGARYSKPLTLSQLSTLKNSLSMRLVRGMTTGRHGDRPLHAGWIL